MLKIYQSTRLSLLTKQLFLDMKNHRQSIFEQATVIVPSMVLSDYLDQQFAQIEGISARTEYRFWGMVQWSMIESVVGNTQVYSQAPLSGVAMQWTIFSYLYQHSITILENPNHPLFKSLKTLFQQKDTIDEKDLQSAWGYSGELAKLFVGYIAMRPDWMARWSAQQGISLGNIYGEGQVKIGYQEKLDKWLQTWLQEGELTLEKLVNTEKLEQQPPWQRAHYRDMLNAQLFLWRALFAKAFIARELQGELFQERLQESTVRVTLPKALYLFTLFTMTPDMFEFLRSISKYIDIYLYHHAISQHYLPDIVDSQWLKKLKAASSETEDSHLDSAHPLVSRFGKQQRDIARVFRDAKVLEDITFLESASEPLPRMLLAGLQDDMANLREEATINTLSCSVEDDSLRVHACHGLLRQLEVLRGEILRWLNEDKSRKLDDVLIVLPDVEGNQDQIRAVFPAFGAYDGYELPVKLTGVISPESENLWQAVSGIYSLLERGFDSQNFGDWLAIDAVCESYDVSHEAMQQAYDALIDAGFRRGFDQRHLGELIECFDGDDRFTFEYALNRLVVGLVMPDAGIYDANIVPQPAIPVAQTEAIEALCAIHQEVKALREQVATITDGMLWLTTIQNRLTERFSAQANTSSYQMIAQTLRDLMFSLKSHKALTAQQDTLYLPLKFILQYVQSQLARHQVSSEPSGVITIGKLSAMRSLPYKLIALVGADSEVFPARDQDQRYNLMDIDKPRVGDRHREWDDLGAFLDVLSNAQEAFWCFYTQYLPQESEQLLPARPVQELLDYLEETLAPEKRHYHIHHSADPFHPDGELTRPAPLWQKVRSKLVSKRQTPSPWISLSVPNSLSEVEEALAKQPKTSHETIALTRLSQDVLRPASTYLRSVPLTTLSSKTSYSQFEPLQPEPLEKWQINDGILQSLIGKQNKEIFQRLPILPAGIYGQYYEEYHRQKIWHLMQTLFTATKQQQLTEIKERAVIVNNMTITAMLPDAMTPQWLQISVSKPSIKHRFHFYLAHLLWNCDGGGESIMAFNDADISLYRLVPIADDIAIVELDKWLTVWQFMQQQPWLMPIEMAWEALQAKNGVDDYLLSKSASHWFAEDKEPYSIDEREKWNLLLGEDEENVKTAVANFAEILLGKMQSVMSLIGEDA